MTTQGISNYSPTSLSKYDFADYFAFFQRDRGWSAYAVTIIHKPYKRSGAEPAKVRERSGAEPAKVRERSGAEPAKVRDTAWHATNSLNKFVPRFFSKTISPNWHRPNYINRFVMWMFLDPPGSKHRNHANPYELASAQDSYHHHGILFIDPRLHDRFESKARFLIADENEAQQYCHSEGYSEFQRTMEEGSKAYVRKWQRDLARAFLNFRGLTVRACHIKKVYDLSDWSTYAAKTIRPMLYQDADNAFTIFPQYHRVQWSS